MRHLVIIPARNEDTHLPATLGSLLAQSEKPDRIVVVDDGSSDGTAALVSRIQAENPTVALLSLPDRGHRKMGGAVVKVFNAGYERFRQEGPVYVSKFDADLQVPMHYCKNLLSYLDENPDVGTAGGMLIEHIGGRDRPLRTPADHVVGALKTLRRTVFEAIGGFIPISSWDILDLVQVRRLGYRTVRLENLKVLHLRQHGSAEGTLSGRMQWGQGAYVIRSHPLFVIGRGLYRMLEPPYVVGGIAFWLGYLKAVLRRTPRLENRDLARSLRWEQLHRILHSNTTSGAGVASHKDENK